MTAPETLQQFQGRLARKLAAAREAPLVPAWLAARAGPCDVLLPMDQTGAVVPVESIRALPHVQPWFLGVANLRGSLHGVVDLADFLGARGSAPRDSRTARLVTFGAATGLMCALLVDEVVGMRRHDALELAPPEPVRPAWAASAWTDDAGRRWQALDLAALARDTRFLRIDRGLVAAAA